MQTLAFRYVTNARRPYFAFIHTSEPPDDEEWHVYVKAVAAALAHAHELLPILVLSDGGGPNGKQRKEIADAAADSVYGGVAHVFTTSSFMRAAVNAFRMLSWSTAVAHRPSRFADVCHASGLAPYAVFSDFVAVQSQLPAPVRVMRLVEESMVSGSQAQL